VVGDSIDEELMMMLMLMLREEIYSTWEFGLPLFVRLTQRAQ
jgi:hypothetical protein